MAKTAQCHLWKSK